MNELGKTGIFVAIAGAVCFAALISSRPEIAPEDLPDEAISKGLCAKLETAEHAAGLKTVRFDTELRKPETFRVTQSGGRWVIPSHANFPANAQQRVKDAATAFVGVKAVSIASESPADHARFGVLNPEESKATAESNKPEDVGTLVEIFDDKDSVLVSLIVGREVKNPPGHRFVRYPTGSRVYVAKFDPGPFTGKFEDWIEKDLLKLNQNDISAVSIHDQSPVVVQTPDGEVQRLVAKRMELNVEWDEKDWKWKLLNMSSFAIGSRRSVPVRLLPNEELDTARLDEMKSSLADLKIADVKPRPTGLNPDMSSNKLIMENNVLEELMDLGLHDPDALAKRRAIPSGANGDVLVKMKDGIDYTLRFGNIAGVQKGSGVKKVNRYLAVNCALNESRLPKPELKPVPELPAGPKNAEEKAADVSKKEPGAAEQAGNAKEKKEESATPDEIKQGNAERDRIIKENERLTNEWKEKHDKAATRVTELNNRFGQFVFVVSEDSFKKIRIGRSEAIREKQGGSDDENYQIDAFRKLAEEGMKKPAETPPPGGSGGNRNPLPFSPQ